MSLRPSLAFADWGCQVLVPGSRSPLCSALSPGLLGFAVMRARAAFSGVWGIGSGRSRGVSPVCDSIDPCGLSPPAALRVSHVGQVPTFAKKQFWRFFSVLRGLGLV